MRKLILYENKNAGQTSGGRSCTMDRIAEGVIE
jgi:hypothetical protein